MRTSLSSSSLCLAALSAALFTLSACSAAPDETELVGAIEDVGNNEGSLSNALPVGTILISTTDVNLRSSASTSAKILHVIPSGSEVTVVASAPKSGFYNVKHDGVVGWSFGKYYKLAPSQPVPAGTPVNAGDLVLALGSCQQLAGTSMFRKDSGASKTVPLCGMTGAIWWKADLDIDCDGGQGTACTSDPYYQPDTATVDSLGNPLDASTLPYVVIPGPSNGFDYKLNGLKMGSVVAVVYGNAISYGVLGDVGPQEVIGEASYAMAKELGINPSPISGGVDSGVTYVAFTGTDGVVAKKEDHAKAVEIGQARANAIIQAK